MYPPLRENGKAQAKNKSSARSPSRHVGMYPPNAPPPIVEICQKMSPPGAGTINGGTANKKYLPRSTSRPTGMHISKAPPLTVAIHRNPLPLAPPHRGNSTAEAQKKNRAARFPSCPAGMYPPKAPPSIIEIPRKHRPWSGKVERRKRKNKVQSARPLYTLTCTSQKPRRQRNDSPKPTPRLAPRSVKIQRRKRKKESVHRAYPPVPLACIHQKRRRRL